MLRRGSLAPRDFGSPGARRAARYARRMRTGDREDREEATSIFVVFA
jgi:hypothetical protein